MPDYLLRETGDKFLREDSGRILREDATNFYLWISDRSYATARLESFSFTEMAEQGQVGVGGLAFDDQDLTMSIPALKAMSVADFRSTDSRLFTGYTHTRTTQRGPMAVAGQREWDVELLDVNTLADDYVLQSTDSADRSAETDYARITWLLTTVFGTTGGVTAGVVPNTNTVTMDAIDYRGRKPREVLDQCAEITGKNWFIYRHTSGPLLYYDLHTGTSLTSTAKISDTLSDVDSSTVWAPVGAPTVRRSPDEVFSTVHMTWSGGTITVSNSTTLATYRRRDINVLDTGVRTNTTATAKANAFLASSSVERTYVSDLAISVPAANVNDIRAGMRVQIKLARHGISAYTYYRVTRRTIRAMPGQNGVDDTRYLVTLSLLDTLAPTRYLYQRGSDEVWEVKSNATPDGASVIVNRSGITVTGGAISVQNAASATIIDANGLGADTVNAAQIVAGAVNTAELNASAVIQLVTNSGATVVINSSGIAVTSGAITVTNSGAVVIIDGTSNMFKIVTSGTFTHTQASGTNGTNTLAISGTGLAAQSPAFVAYITEGTTPASTDNRDLGRFSITRGTGAADPRMYAATTSGGAVTTGFESYVWTAFVFSTVSGGNPALTLTVDNGGSSSHSAFVRYHLLKESAI